jgi:phosphoadenosine phosphosulfate reductase
MIAPLPSPAPTSSPLERAQGVLDWAWSSYPDEIVLACSFGGTSGMVLLDLIARSGRNVPVFYLDTGLLFDQTLALVERVRARYGIDPIAVRPTIDLIEQAGLHGDELWLRDPDACCAIRKVEPNRAFLLNYRAWITGVRRDQSPTRSDLGYVEFDDPAGNGIAKISPLADWSEADVRTYLEEHDVPYNELLDRGYTSLGCKPCTRFPVDPANPRSGRWVGFEKTECGLHSTS